LRGASAAIFVNRRTAPAKKTKKHKTAHQRSIERWCAVLRFFDFLSDLSDRVWPSARRHQFKHIGRRLRDEILSTGSRFCTSQRMCEAL